MPIGPPPRSFSRDSNGARPQPPRPDENTCPVIPARANMTTEPEWLGWARALQALAQTGLHYAKDRFDIERYEQARAIAAAMMAAGADQPAPRILELFRQDAGYATPKVAVRGAVFRDDRVLLVRERNDDRWSLPGGWADVNLSPAECVEREIQEESGFT